MKESMYRAFFGVFLSSRAERERSRGIYADKRDRFLHSHSLGRNDNDSEEGGDHDAENDLGIAPSQFEQNESGSECDPKLVCSLFCPDEDVRVIEIQTVGATILPHVLLHDIDEVVVRQNF